MAVGVELSGKNPFGRDGWKGYRNDTGEAVLDPSPEPGSIAGDVDLEVLEFGL